MKRVTGAPPSTTNVMFPVGVTPATLLCTVAVKVTGWPGSPKPDEVTDTVSTVVEAALVTVWTSRPLPLRKLASPE